MKRLFLIRSAFFTAVVITILHIGASVFFLYSYYWWFDIPLHFLAGICTGFLSLWLRFDATKDTPARQLRTAVFGAFLFGVLWELFEYGSGITQNGLGNYSLDTQKDLAIDVLGAYGAYLFTVLFTRNKDTT
ncbi:MAG: hypothetical protein NUV54_03425 [Candidatus Taylorbacteria bacterium]|nr:hypothetical protein [Candidatus Taylorbacteria bacterium]